MAAIKTELFIQANQKGFDALEKAINGIGESMTKSMNQSAKTSSAFTRELEKLGSSVTGLVDSTKNLTNSLSNVSSKASDGGSALRNMEWSVSSLIKGMEYLIQVQIRWYGTRLLLDTIAGGFRDAAVAVVTYSNSLEMATAAMARHITLAGGESVASASVQAGGVTTAMRKATTNIPISMKDLVPVTESFIGAGVTSKSVEEMTNDLAKIKNAFGEIDFKQFSLAAVGAFNVFRDQLAVGGTDAQKFRDLMEQMLATASAGVIRPENFTKVIQYLAAVGDVSGFSTQQLFAMAGALANTAIPAANASRLLQGMMQSLSRPQAVENLNAIGKQVGITIDKAQSLESQFDKILAIIGKFTAGGASIEKMGYINKIVPAQQQKDLLILARNHETYAKILQAEYAAAGTGLEKVNEIMNKPLSKQWDLFVNLMNEIGRSAGDATAPLHELMSVFIDMANGILVAVDSTGLYQDKIVALGVAGQNARDVTIALKEAFVALKDALSPLIGLLGNFLQGLGFLINDLFKIPGASALVAAAFIAMGFPFLINSVGKLIVALQLYIGVLGNATLAEGTAGLAAGSLNTYLLILVSTVTILLAAFKALNDEMDKTDELDKKRDERIKSLNRFTVEAAWDTNEKKIADLKSKIAKEREGGPGFGSGANLLQKRLDPLERELHSAEMERAQLQAAIYKFEHTPDYLGGKPEKTISTPKGEGKAYLDRAISNIKREYNALYDTIASEEKRQLALIDEQHELGLISDQEWLKQRNNQIQSSVQRELEVVLSEGEKIQKAYQAQRDAVNKLPESKMSAESKKNKIAEINDTEASEIQALNKKVAETVDKGIRQEVDTRLKVRKDVIAIETDKSNALLALENERAKALDALHKHEADMTKTVNDWMYQNHLIGATQYYETSGKLIDKELEDSKNSAWVRYWNEMNSLNLRQSLHGVEEKEYKKLENDKTLTTQKYLDEVDAIEQKSEKSRLTRQQQMANDYKKLWEGPDGFREVTNKALTDSLADFTNWGVMISNAWKGFVSGMQSEFEAFFTDGFKGTLKSFGDYVTSFLTMLNKTIAKLMAEQLTGYIGNILKIAVNSYGGSDSVLGNIFGAIFGGMSSSGSSPALAPNQKLAHAGGVVGGYMPSFSYPTSLFYNAPRLHSGLASDEYPAILQRGEQVIPRSQAGKGANISVEIKNESGQALKVKDSQASFNGQEYIVTVWLDALQRNAYGLRDAVGG